jgi:hypothetical protein
VFIRGSTALVRVKCFLFWKRLIFRVVPVFPSRLLSVH